MNSSPIRQSKIRRDDILDIQSPRPNQGTKENRCNHCKKDFIYRIDLTKHIREEHKTYKPCRNLGDCSYALKCRYNHKQYPKGTQVCFECGFTFMTVHDLMRHRKEVHKVPMCKEFLRNNCGFSADDCYHTHSKQPHTEHKPVQDVENKRNTSNENSEGFWDAPVNLAPPLGAKKIQQGPTHLEWDQMKEKFKQLNQMMERFL